MYTSLKEMSWCRFWVKVSPSSLRTFYSIKLWGQMSDLRSTLSWKFVEEYLGLITKESFCPGRRTKNFLYLSSHVWVLWHPTACLEKPSIMQLEMFCWVWRMWNQGPFIFYFIMIYFNPHPKSCLLILEREEGIGRKGRRETKRERETSIWQTVIGCLPHVPCTYNLGVCPDRIRTCYLSVYERLL